MFLSRNRKNNVYPCKPQIYYIKVGLRGSKLYRSSLSFLNQQTTSFPLKVNFVWMAVKNEIQFLLFIDPYCMFWYVGAFKSIRDKCAAEFNSLLIPSLNEPFAPCF